MTSPSESGPKKMQTESTSFLEVSPEALIALFHCRGCGTVRCCPALPSHLLPAWCSPCIDCDAQLGAPPLPAAVLLHAQAAVHQETLPLPLHLSCTAGTSLLLPRRDRYRASTNHTLEKSWRKIGRVSASVVF